LRAKPGHFPAKLTVDVTNLEIHDHIKVSDVKLPEGVEAVLPSERSVVSCVAMRARKDEEEVAAVPGAAPTGTTVPPTAAAAKTPSKAPPKK